MVEEDFHRGNYEGQGGFIKLESIPTSTNSSVKVKVGRFAMQRPFRLRHLHPETTLDGENPSPNPLSMGSKFGQEVVVIGPDLDGNLGSVGHSGTVLRPPPDIKDGETYIICRDAGGYAKFFPTSSLCRSGEFPQ
jgi:hypothetical protein